MKTTADLCHAARPVCFDNKVEDYDYSLQGTAFLVRFHGGLFAVTAEHVLKNYRPDRVLIPYEVGSEHFLPFDDAFRFRTQETEDTDHCDLAVFSVAERLLDKTVFDEGKVYNLDAERRFQVDNGTKLVLHGFPDPINEVDYDARHLAMQRFSISACARGNSHFQGMKELDFDTAANMSTFSGMSGSPVFAIFPINFQQSAAMLDGMLLRATPESRHGFYLDATIIRNVIAEHVKEIRNAKREAL
jgi:hypothetical protein